MKKSTFLIAGKHAVIEALKNKNRKTYKVYLTEDSFKKINRDYQNTNLFKNKKVIFKSNKELNNLCGREGISHQGLVAEIEKMEELSLKEFISNSKKNNINLIALEEVTDPRNIGSIIRSAVSFDIDGIIIKERSFPSTSKYLYKSASGGVEHIKIFTVSNVKTAINELKKKNFWVSAFDLTGEKDINSHNWNGKNILLFGSEGYGLRKKTITSSDYIFRIKINKNIESLNIANTVSIVCHHIKNNIEKT